MAWAQVRRFQMSRIVFGLTCGGAGGRGLTCGLRVSLHPEREPPERERGVEMRRGEGERESADPVAQGEGLAGAQLLAARAEAAVRLAGPVREDGEDLPRPARRT